MIRFDSFCVSRIDLVMEPTWSEVQVLELIQDISQYKCLWDPRDSDKKNNYKKLQCYTALAEKYDSTPYTIKRKWFNILQTFRNLRRKMKSSDDYKPVWFAFDSINEFMKDIYTPREPSDSQNKDCNDCDSDDEIVFEKASTCSEKNSTQMSDSEQQPSTSHRALQRRVKATKRGRFQYSDNYARKNLEVAAIDEDECKIFCKLIEVKLRKLNEHSRQFVMNEINQLFFRVFNEITSNTQIDNNLVEFPRESFSFFKPESSAVTVKMESPSFSLSDESQNPTNTDF